MEIYIILRSSNRGNDNTNRELWGPAYVSRQEALKAILEEYESMLKNGDDPGRNALERPEIVVDEENSNHDHAALKFKDDDARGLSRIDIWDPTKCPDGLEDMPELSFWWERFDIETVNILQPQDNETVIRQEKEYITEQIRLLGEYMWDNDGPKETIRLETPVAITRVTDARGYLDISNFFVTAVSPGRNDIPMVHGHFEQHPNEEECQTLNCNDMQNGHYYENRHWKIDGLLKALELQQ